MKRRIVLLCLLILCLLSACGGTAEAPPGADAPGGASLEERTFVLGDLTLTLPEKVQDPRWSGPKGGVAQAEFSWGGENYVFRVKKSRRADNLSDISDVSDAFIGPEGGELAANATRCVVDGAKGYIAWNVRGYAFTLSMEASASDRKLFALYHSLLDQLLSDCSQPPQLSVRCGDQDVPAVRTVCAWKRRKNLGDGGRSLVVTDGLHPLQMLDEESVSLTPLPVPPGGEIELDFQLPPDELTVRCWSEETARALLEDPDLLAAYEAQGTELTVTEGRVAPPGPGSYIYEVRAEWSDDIGYGGTVSYGFYTTCS